MASSLVAKSRTMLERGSAVLAQPIRLFSHLCWLSNSIFHLKERQLRRSKTLGHPLSAQKGSHIIASRNSQFACYHSPVRRKNTFWFQPCLTAWGSWLAWRSSPENPQLMTEAKFHFHYASMPQKLTCLSFLSASGMPEVIVTSAGPSTLTQSRVKEFRIWDDFFLCTVFTSISSDNCLVPATSDA